MTSVQRRKKREVAKRLRKKLRRRVLAAFPEVDNDVFKPTVKLINNIIFLDLNIRKETCISTILSMAEFFYGKTFGHGKTFRYGKELRKCGTIYFYKRPITARTGEKGIGILSNADLSDELKNSDKSDWDARVVLQIYFSEVIL